MFSLCVCLVLLVSAASVSAFADMRLVPAGETVGIRLDMGGVVVAGLNEIDAVDGKYSPAARVGIKKGDVITALNGEQMHDAAQFIGRVGGLGSDAVTLTVREGSGTKNVTVTPAKCADGAYRLGLWLRDSVSGIGTMTYYDPETGAYGALGHGVCDGDDGTLMENAGGTLTKAQIVDVIKGREGTPGELCGSVADRQLGSVDRNTDRGIFGTLDTWEAAQAIPVAQEKDIHPGPATVLSTVSGEGVQPYDVEISRVYHDPGSVRNMMITVTDPALLQLTGGIVQGMSGSPIIQDGKLVGAVTHVLVSDPTRGYGITIENMMKAA